VAIHDAEGDVWWRGRALRSLGSALHKVGSFERAAGYQRRAVTVFAVSGALYDQAKSLVALGITLREVGDVDEARECWREALDIYAQLDLPEAAHARDLLAGQRAAGW
jgi:tetratricopeptide (TPR) repeat protein